MTNADDLASRSPLSTGDAAISAVSFGIRAWALALAAGLLAGVLAWAIGEAIIVPEVGVHSEKAKIDVPPSVPATRNGIISFAALGAVLGLAMGLAGGLVTRSVSRSLIAAAIGLLMAGGAGGLLSWVIIPLYYAQREHTEITQSLMVHGGVWVAVGAAAGLAFGIGLGGRGALLRGFIGGAAAALLATVVYDFAGGIVFPTAMTDRPVSQTWETRLLARLLVSVLVAAGLVITAETTGSRKSVSKKADA